MTRVLVSRSKGQRSRTPGRFAHRRLDAQTVGVRTCWPWEAAATLPFARPRAALRRPRGRRGAGAYRGGRPPTACLQSQHRVVYMTYECVPTADEECTLQRSLPEAPDRHVRHELFMRLRRRDEHARDYNCERRQQRGGRVRGALQLLLLPLLSE